MRNILLLLFSLLLSNNLFCQVKYDYHWLMGYFSNGSRIEYDFNTNPISIKKTSFPMSMSGCNSTFSSRDGRLDYYTNCCSISDASHQTIVNGDSLNPGFIRNYCPSGYPIRQSALFLPVVSDTNYISLIHQKQEPISFSDSSLAIISEKLLFTRIDRKLKKVEKKNQIISQDTLQATQLTACKHTNGRDWWIIQPKFVSDKYQRILLDSTGFGQPFEQTIGKKTLKAGDGGGQAVFTPDGTKYLRFTAPDQLFIFDFNRTTGILSNFKYIFVDTFGFYFGGISVSPNSRFAYVSVKFRIYQYDLWATDISSSRKIVAEYDGFRAPFPMWFYLAQLAPDCRIYIVPSNGSSWAMHYIKYPDREGTACEVVQHGIIYKDSVQSNATLPNHPNYRLGVVPTYPCDSTLRITTGTDYSLDWQMPKVFLFPNPAGHTVNLSGILPNQKTIFKLYNTVGQLVMSRKVDNTADKIEFDVRNLIEGFYIFTLNNTGGQIVANGKLQIQR
jgi:Secretion system C-terminal sorting domain